MRSDLRPTATTVRSVLACLALCFLVCHPDAAVGQSGVDPDTRIADLVRRIRTVQVPPPTASSKEVGSLVALLAQADALIKTQDSITAFRRYDDQDVIAKLAQMVLVNDRDVRLLAGTILINVVDNSTLCVVLDKLVDPQMVDNDNARFNFLQVVRVVVENNSHFDENDKWVERAANEVRDLLKKRKKEDIAESEELLERIEAEVKRADRKKAGKPLEKEFPAGFSGCMKLPSIGRFEKR